MKRVYRMQIDLRKPEARPQEACEADEGARKDMLLDSSLADVPPATLEPSDFDDPITARELLDAYNGSLRRAQSVAVGRYVQNNIDHNVFYDDWDNKHVITQSVLAGAERISEMVMAPDGNLLRYILERRDGGLVEMGNLMMHGISDLPDAYLKAAPGYWLTATRYCRENDELIRVEQSLRRYDAQARQFEQVEDVTLG